MRFKHALSALVLTFSIAPLLLSTQSRVRAQTSPQKTQTSQTIAQPSFTEEARKNNVTGVVRLRAVLAPDGRVRHILVIKGLPDGLNEKCVAAARQIRFTPATINSHRVAQYIVLEYNFNIY